jgi:hypothetical protein
MLTRKRKSDQEVENTLPGVHAYTFDAMMEPVARFLEFRDCGAMSSLNTYYYDRLWSYVLLCSTRFRNPCIRVSTQNELWLKRHCKLLKTQHLSIGSSNKKDGDEVVREVNFDKIGITHLRNLTIVGCHVIPRLPLYLEILGLTECSGSFYPV